VQRPRAAPKSLILAPSVVATHLPSMFGAGWVKRPPLAKMGEGDAGLRPEGAKWRIAGSPSRARDAVGLAVRRGETSGVPLARAGCGKAEVQKRMDERAGVPLARAGCGGRLGDVFSKPIALRPRGVRRVWIDLHGED
jgi:hypothetical protein